jgi:hypothetical protein
VNHYGFAVVLHNSAEDELTQGIQHLFNIMHVPPRIIFYLLYIVYLRTVWISGLFLNLIQMQ